ncbi:MAG: hypothetical protein JWP89_4127 [Schlesneria sp.]|nr:hypothetical protein [Schlesneria sp.]
MSDMEDNPFRAPESDLRVEGVLSGSREDLRSVAKYQRGIMICILIYLVAGILRLMVPREVQLPLLLGIVMIGLTGTALVFLLAQKIHGIGPAILLAILTLVPCVNLIVLFTLSSKATNILKANGIKVGFLGANPADISSL